LLNYYKAVNTDNKTGSCDSISAGSTDVTGLEEKRQAHVQLVNKKESIVRLLGFRERDNRSSEPLQNVRLF
jgi:hypothetical protein